MDSAPQETRLNAALQLKQRKAELPAWNAVIGLRPRIVHDYMNIDMATVMAFVTGRREPFIIQFLLSPIRLRREDHHEPAQT